MSADRMIRLNALLQRELGQLIEVYVAPEIPHALITITGVRVASNLREALVFFSVYSTHQDYAEKVLSVLLKRRAQLQSALADKVVMKYTPVLRFKYDPTPARADRVMEILSELQIPENEAQDRSGDNRPAEEAASDSTPE